MEIAPALGLAGRIVDLVSSGQTLKDNGLVETATIMEITARLVVNRAAAVSDCLAVRSAPGELAALTGLAVQADIPCGGGDAAALAGAALAAHAGRGEPPAP